MYYDEIVIEGELFYKTTPKGGWIRATNAMLTARLEKLQKELTDADETIEQVKALIIDYGVKP